MSTIEIIIALVCGVQLPLTAWLAQKIVTHETEIATLRERSESIGDLRYEIRALGSKIEAAVQTIAGLEARLEERLNFDRD